eukprot:TRINITY_DN1230_c0_g4_i4.p1 TRINITY_DN1230_c0_g4~~TRINITY_DN1230_c0_g4_i4.p1  ORF type:complete len:242 (-),score=53.01 TRINITY_DN1230_c0_g4_i4:47-772(-)
MAQHWHGAPIASSGVNVRHNRIFPAKNHIVVVNDNGEVWAHYIQPGSVGDAVHLPGPAVAVHGVPPKFVTLDKHHSRLLVINASGEVWAHDLDLNSRHTGNAYHIQGPALGHAAHDLDVYASKHGLVVRNSAGELWVHHYTDRNAYGGASKMNSPPVASSGTPPRFVFKSNRRFIVVNTNGEVWAHQRTASWQQGANFGGAYKASHELVAVGGTPAKAVISWKNFILVINQSGEVWAHTLH